MTEASDAAARFALLRVTTTTQVAATGVAASITLAASTIAVLIQNLDAATSGYVKLGVAPTVTVTTGIVVRAERDIALDVGPGTVLQYIGDGAITLAITQFGAE